MPESPFDLDFDRFISNIRREKRGAAPGPSGMTTEHLHPLLENDASLVALFRVAVFFSRGQVPPNALEGLKLGRITTLEKPDGGVRGIVVGDVFRRIVARTIAQQIGDQVEKATAPYQFALKTRAGCECVSHTLRTLAEMDEATTILSVDGVGAFDLISRSAMMQGLVDMPDGVKVLPFVRMFYGTPSKFLWEDELGVVNHIPQGEGGEQGDPLMPLLFSLGQHRALVSVAGELRRCEHLFAFHDDLYVTAQPDRVVDIHHSLATHLWNQARITLHQGKTAIWNQGGIYPEVAMLWRRLPGVKIPLQSCGEGTFFLSRASRASLFLVFQWAVPSTRWQSWRPNPENTTFSSTGSHPCVISRSAWCLLLYCAAARANFWLRTVLPELSGDFAREHDASLWRCMCQLLHINPATIDVSAKASASLPLAAGGLGLRSAERLRHAAHWASWADMMKMLHSRVPSVATNFIASLEAGEATPSIQSVLSCVDNLAGVGFVVPSWEDLVADPPLMRRRRLTPHSPSVVGRRKQPGWWILPSAGTPSSQRLTMPRQPCSGRKPDQWLLQRLSPFPP